MCCKCLTRQTEEMTNLWKPFSLYKAYCILHCNILNNNMRSSPTLELFIEKQFLIFIIYHLRKLNMIKLMSLKFYYYQSNPRSSLQFITTQIFLIVVEIIMRKSIYRRLLRMLVFSESSPSNYHFLKWLHA